MTKFLKKQDYTFVGDKMKRKLKKVLMPIFLSVICGSICGRIVYDIYDKELETDMNGEKIYLIQAGAYSTYDNMVNNTSLNNYIYYEDNDGLFKSIIGVTENYDNIEKIIDAYLVVKHECKNKDFMERHDFISLVIEKTKQI